METVATLNLPAGSFLVTAKTVVFSNALTANDDVACALIDGSGSLIDEAFTQLNDVSNSGYDQQTVALAGATTSGGTMTLECFDGLSEATAFDAVITAVPVVSVSAALRHLPLLRSGVRAGRAAG